MPLLYVLAVYIGLNYITLPGKLSRAAEIGMLMTTTFFLLKMLTSFVAYLFQQVLSNKQQTEQRGKQAKGILLIVKIIIWMIGILFLIDNLGYDITTLVAGLGIGGIAIALAAQTVLGDLFSYLVIFFDKPFENGDFIIVGDKMGTIEHIGIKTTRLRTLGGEQLICSNTDLTNSRVHNYKRMNERRIAFSIGVVYDTPAIKLKNIPILIKQVIEPLKNTRFERAHFQKLGAFSLDFEVVYFILTPDYNMFMDRQQEINVGIIELFKSEEIEFAFPTQTMLLHRNESEFNDPDKKPVPEKNDW